LAAIVLALTDAIGVAVFLSSTFAQTGRKSEVTGRLIDGGILGYIGKNAQTRR